ncbi:MAG: LytTR family DNA-binding domain-containing protein [Coprobacillaceae bacterium]
MVKINIDQSDKYDDIYVDIKCPVIDKRIESIVTQINNSYSAIIGCYEEKTYAVGLKNIYYIESIDDKSFIYENNRVLECSNKLYELEEQLKGSTFVRVSKSCILNIDKLDSVKSLINGKYEAYLLNEERIVISRHYVSEFKKKFGL